MRELLRSNDLVHLSWAQAMLAAVVNRHLGGGGLVVAATHMPLGFDTAHELRLGRAAAAA